MANELSKEEQLKYVINDIYTKEQALLEEFADIKKDIEAIRHESGVDTTKLRQRLRDNINNRKALEKEYRDAYKIFNGV